MLRFQIYIFLIENIYSSISERDGIFTVGNFM